MTCLKCGAELSDKANFCIKCGCKLDETYLNTKSEFLIPYYTRIKLRTTLLVYLLFFVAGIYLFFSVYLYLPTSVQSSDIDISWGKIIILLIHIISILYVFWIVNIGIKCKIKIMKILSFVQIILSGISSICFFMSYLILIFPIILYTLIFIITIFIQSFKTIEKKCTSSN